MPFRILALALICFCAAPARQSTDTLHARAIVVDTHNDVVQRMLAGDDLSSATGRGHSDLPRFRTGGVDAEFFSIWVPPDKKRPSYAAQADAQIDAVLKFVDKNPSSTGLARTAGDVRSLAGAGKFAVLMGMEGGHPVGNDLRRLDHFYARGVRYMGLTWNNSTEWASSAKDENDRQHPLRRKGLTAFGKKVVRRMNDLGMLVDVSHAGEKTFWDVLAVSTRPVLASHSSAWSLCHHWRNLKDDQLKAVAKSGGVVCVNFGPWFLDSSFAGKEAAMRARNKARIDEYERTLTGDAFMKELAVGAYLRREYDSIRPPLSALIDHIDYIAKLIGSDHVGLGSDFDGIWVTPAGMDDVTDFPKITRELKARGYSDEAVKNILGGNVLRLLAAVQKGTRPPLK